LVTTKFTFKDGTIRGALTVRAIQEGIVRDLFAQLDVAVRGHTKEQRDRAADACEKLDGYLEELEGT
jgi:hypothetical protein